MVSLSELRVEHHWTRQALNLAHQLPEVPSFLGLAWQIRRKVARKEFLET